MNRLITIIAVSSMLYLVGCFKPNEKGIKGQAYLTLGDYHKGHAMVDLPIYCYSTEIFEQQLESLKTELSAEWKVIGEHNAKLKADFTEAQNTYFYEVKVFLKYLFEEKKNIFDEEITNLNQDFLQSTTSKKIQEQQSKIGAVIKDIEELEAQQRATKEVTEVLSPFIAEQRRLLDRGYANIEGEIIRANDLIEKINKVIVGKNLALSLYEKLDLDFSRQYTDSKTCWMNPDDLYYPNDTSAIDSSFASLFSRIEEYAHSDFFSYEKVRFSEYLPLETKGRVVFHTDKEGILSNAHIASLPAELTPYLSNEIEEAFYKHNILAKPRLNQTNLSIDNSAENADDALLVYANKSGISVAQVKSIIKDSVESGAFERQILAKKSSLESLENFDISSAVASEISDLSDTLIADKMLIDDCIVLIDEADDFNMLFEAFRQMPTSTNLVGDSLNYYRFEEYLKAQGFNRPRRPNYESISDRELYEDLILEIYSSSNTIVRTDLNGEFIIPEGTTRYFTYVKDDDNGVYWTASISGTTDKILLAPSSIVATNPINLLFSESELEELLFIK